MSIVHGFVATQGQGDGSPPRWLQVRDDFPARLTKRYKMALGAIAANCKNASPAGPATNLSTLVPVLPLSALRRTITEAFAVPALERTRNTRRDTDRRGAPERRMMRAQWPARLERRGELRRAADAAGAAREARAAAASHTPATAPLRKGLIIDVYA